MSMTFLNAVLLAGLAAVAIPPIIHLLNRKRFDVVPWGAMQFLQFSERTRRRLFLEEVLLMLVRMGLIALTACALAAPMASGPVLSRTGGAGPRDVVLVIDGSASMGYDHNGRCAYAAAKDWASALLDELSPGDGVAVVHAKQRPVAALAEQSHDLDEVRSAIQGLTAPRGGCDWPGAVHAAEAILAGSTKPQRSIIILTDGQRHGWADANAMLRWELFAKQQRSADAPIWTVQLDPDRPANPSGWSLAPLRASRSVAAAGQTVTLRTTLEHSGTKPTALPRIVLEIDGQPAGDVSVPRAGDQTQLPITVKHRFPSPGSHLMTVRVDGSALPGGERQDFAVEIVPILPILLIDGDANPAARTRGTDFFRDALAPARDPNPTALVNVDSIAEFDPAHLTQEIKGLGTPPRAAVLVNVERLTAVQQDAVSKFLASGGGLLVTLGDRCDARHCTEELFRNGSGWLPAGLTEPTGDLANLAQAPQPQPATFFHPALDLFRDPAAGGLGDARFPRYWKLAPAAGSSTVIARFNNDQPWLAEKSLPSGRVIVSAVPLDNSWRTNLVELPAYAPLIHELVYYLAGARSAESNLSAGQPIRYRPTESDPGDWTVTPPGGPAKPAATADGQITVEDTREPGVYRLHNATRNITRYYVVPPDPRESDLAPWSDEDRRNLERLLPTLQFRTVTDELTQDILSAENTLELWWLGLLGVTALLLFELWLTRRRVRS